MQLQTSIRSCEGNHYVVTVINDAAENSGLLSNNPCAQGAFEGRGPVAKETDDIQNGPLSTVSFSLFLPTNRFLFCFFLPQFLLLLFRNQLPHDLWRFWGLWEVCLCEAFWSCCFIYICVCIDFIKYSSCHFDRVYAIGWALFCWALMSIIYYLHIPPLKSDLVVIKPEANWGLLNNLHIYGEHLTPDSLEENKGNKKIYRLRFVFSHIY